MISIALLESFFTQYGYAAVFLVLVACGFGVPIPEDITLVTGGVISGLGYANVHIMFLVGMAGVLVGDGLMFTAGRIYGDKILKFRPIARVMTPKRYAQVQENSINTVTGYCLLPVFCRVCVRRFLLPPASAARFPICAFC